MEKNEKLLSAIFNVGRMIREQIGASNCLLDFTQAEIEVMKFIWTKKSTTMREIADYMHIKPSSATPIINHLVSNGSLKRTKDKNDRRIIYIGLTSKGLKSLQKKYKTIHKTLKNIFGKLNNNDRDNLIKIFEKIHEDNI
jgi:DNA-binding MarR family transcriptional regulator